MYLHREDRELFHDIILAVSEKSGLDENIIEKDYYVTFILRELALQNPKIVFKGGTSLSKAYHVIDRFSEDIDITFEEHIGEARRKKLKYKLLKSVSEKLLLPIENWDKIESDKNYNHYDFRYESVLPARKEFLYSYIKVETALMTYAYPTEKRQIDNIIYTYIKDTDYDIIAKFGLIPFEMKAQSLVRTFIDKLFAVCDYYLTGKSSRNSRHLYDIYKIGSYITVDEDFLSMVEDVRLQRAGMSKNISPSANVNVKIRQVAEDLYNTGFYKKDYEVSTTKLIKDDIGYEEVVDYYLEIIQNIF